jgi:hypothetical protein
MDAGASRVEVVPELVAVLDVVVDVRVEQRQPQPGRAVPEGRGHHPARREGCRRLSRVAPAVHPPPPDPLQLQHSWTPGDRQLDGTARVRVSPRLPAALPVPREEGAERRRLRLLPPDQVDVVVRGDPVPVGLGFRVAQQPVGIEGGDADLSDDPTREDRLRWRWRSHRERGPRQRTPVAEHSVDTEDPCREHAEHDQHPQDPSHGHPFVGTGAVRFPGGCCTSVHGLGVATPPR